MIDRKLKVQIETSLRNFPIVGLIGARQVGKTTLAKMISHTWPKKVMYLDLERPSDLAKLDEAELYLEQHADSMVILDEIQRKPGLYAVLRALIDAKRRNGRFLILGSASPEMIRRSSESLAGRIVYHELSPFSLAEVQPTQKNISKLWCRGGYPRSFLAKSEKESNQWREAFIQTHLERDIPNLGVRIPAATLKRFWQMLCHCHGQLWNANKIAISLGTSATTVRHYLDLLQDTFMVRQLQPFHLNIKKRLVKSPKVYLRDSGLLHSLLRIQNQEDLIGHPSMGTSWEGWVIEQVSTYISNSWSTFFYRTSGGAEIDLIIQPAGKKPIIAIEIKYSLDPRPTKGFWSAFSDLKLARGFVVYPGQEYYPLGKKVFALPASELDRIAHI